FCCQGCRMVFEILNKAEMSDYYKITENPGSRRHIKIQEDKFTYLDNEKIAQLLVAYTDGKQTHVNFHLPQIHCSSCLWLIENLHRLNKGVVSSKVNFTSREAAIIFDNKTISLRQLAELLASIGYEPHISLSDKKTQPPTKTQSGLARIGVAGFCFANIMLLSFPEYLGIDRTDQHLVIFFRYFSLLISIPIVFYSASGLFYGAWTSIRNKFINIDVPISVAVLITFGRSVYEIVTATGSGYLDSMSGIIFFMLVGRMLQNKTYDGLRFDRDYTSYFPVAVTRLTYTAGETGKETVMLSDIKLDDTLLVHSQELIAADGILMKGKALIDYSFVTGESLPVQKEMGEIVYAGGRQIGPSIQILVIKEVAQSYLTKLWNRDEMKTRAAEEKKSFVHFFSQYFGWITLGIAGTAAVYWWMVDPIKIWNSATAVLIIACPCALLLSNTFTNGNILRLLGRSRLYLRNAQTIENIAGADHIVFDKTGTLTTGKDADLEYVGIPLKAIWQDMICLLAAQSSHPLSKAIARQLDSHAQLDITDFSELPGKGIRGQINGDEITIGSKEFVTGKINPSEETAVYVSIAHKVEGKFIVRNNYRENILLLIAALKKRYSLSVLSGDNDGEKYYLQKLLGQESGIRFNQTPEDKLEIIKELQSAGKKVIMIGDGLNDAGALRQAEVGIAVSDNCNNFTPASDAIIDAGKLALLPGLLQLCRTNKRIVTASFIVSILYNLAGIFFAVQGHLSPMIAAILMPLSSLTILLIAFGASSFSARQLGLQ
ncbi:MAG: heavy metal translocating P-type ATPase metal-binding domain-containing protein, partial [Chitinophagaceae bacterium]